MALVEAIDHVTVVTSDMDRLLGLYRRVLDATVLVDLDAGGPRHALVVVGQGETLEATDDGRQERAHVALTAPTAEGFEEIRQRVRAESGASGVVVYDMGPMLTLYFDDFDGTAYEVNWYKPGRSTAN